MLRILFLLSIFLIPAKSFAYSVGKAKIIDCAVNHSGSCTWIVSKEFINPNKNLVTTSISLYQSSNAIFSVKQLVSVKKWNNEGTVYEVQVIGVWNISPDQRKKILKTRPLLKFVKLYKKQKRTRWVNSRGESEVDLFASN